MLQLSRVIAVVASTITMWAVLPRAAHAQAPNYGFFRVNVGVGGVNASGTESYGINASVEPMFNLLDQLSVGARLEGAVIMSGSLSSQSQAVTVNQWVSAPILAKAEYYFTESKVRPFAGMGLGIYYVGGQSAGTSGQGAAIAQQAGRYFGLAPQLGVEIGGFRLVATYNAILGADIEVRQSVGNVAQAAKFSRNYLTLELGGRFGGGRK